MQEEKMFFESSDGLKLCGVLTVPEKKNSTVQYSTVQYSVSSCAMA